MAHKLNDNEKKRLWEHALHSQERFDNRLNIFLVFQSILIAAVSTLYTRTSTSKMALFAIIVLGIALTVIWFYAQLRERFYLIDLESQARKEFPEYKNTCERRKKYRLPIPNTELLTFGVPLVVVFLWLALWYFLVVK